MRVGRWKTSFAIPLVITHDLIDEQDKTIILTLTGWDGVGYDLGATRIHTLTIKDIQNEEITKPIVSFASLELTVNEAVGRHIVTLRIQPVTKPKPTDLENLPVEPGIPVFFTVSSPATTGADYAKLSGTVAVAAGVRSVTIPVVITDDSVQEEDDTIILTLSDDDGYDLGARMKHTLTIADNNEIPKASFASSTMTVSEAVGTHGVKVSLHPAPTTNISLGYEVSGPATVRADYTKLSSSVVLRAIRR